MRDWMTLHLPAPTMQSPRPTLLSSQPLRAIAPAALAALMLDAYRGTVDDAGESLADATAEVQKLLAGDFGPLDHDATCILCDTQTNSPVAAAIITRDRSPIATGEPFLAFSLTHPSRQRQGLARWTLRSAIASLTSRGERSLHLVVTRANTPAVNLYTSLGFKTTQSKP
jgi:ribosomal protein S18 acetylase RimI-like enzyme